MTTPKPSGDHRALLSRAVEFCRDPTVSEADALALIEHLCGIAFNDGCAATNQLILRDLELLRTSATARLQ